MQRWWIRLGVAATIVAVALVFHCKSGAPVRAQSDQPVAKLPSIAPAPTRPSEAWVAAAVAASDDDPAGELRLEGQVLAADGQPVKGATVTVNANPARTATSSEDGSFFVDGLLARPYTVVAVADTGVAGPVTVRLSATSDPVILRLHAGASAEIAVVDGANAAVGAATVELRALAIVAATADAKGIAVIASAPPGDYLLVARAEGFAPAYRRVRLAAGHTALRIALVRGGEIAGMVRDSRGGPVAGARVTWIDAGNPAADLDPRRDGVETDAQGAFRLAPVPVGTLRVAAHHADHAPGLSKPIALAAGQTVDGVEIVLDDQAIVAGRVVTPDGAGVGGAAVRVTTAPGGIAMGEPRQAVSRADGRFELTGLPRRPVVLVAVGEAAASDNVAVDLAAKPEARDVVLTLSLDGKIAGVVMAGDEPVEGAEVWASALDGAAEARLRGPIRDLTDAGGRFTLTGVRPGRYELRTHAPNDPDHSAAWLRQTVSANAGDTDVVIRLVPDGAITGKLAFSDGTAPSLFTVSFGAGPRVSFSSRDGSFTVAPVPPGEYTVAVSGPELDELQVAGVRVKPKKSTDVGTIAVRRGRKLVGRVVAPDGTPVPNATVAAGRRMFGGGARLQDDTMQMPGFSGVRRDTTDERGAFAISGLSDGDLSIVAEHDQLGRSAPVRIAAGATPPPLELVVTPFAAIEGQVTRNGRAYAGAMLHVTPQSAPGMTFGVVAGADGRFRFDRLAADTYTLSAVASNDPTHGFGAYTKTIALAAGQVASVDVAIAEAGAALAVTPRADRPLTFAQVFLIAGAASPANGLALEAAVASSPRWGVAYFTGRAPARLEHVDPGAYSVCVEPVPIELTDPPSVWAYIEREGDRLPVYCKAVEVAPTPPEQALDIPVKIPAYVRPPSGK